MRVITGSAKGRKLAAPEGLATRPTSDMAKEAVFSIIQFEVEGAAVLDLFAGSGQLGIEALSRGARLAVFVDTRREAINCVLENLAATKLAPNARATQNDAASFLLTSKDLFDIAFVDPPYQSGVFEKVLPLLAGRMSAGGVILCETEKNEQLPDVAGTFTLKKEYRYGKAKITTYRQGDKQ